ncbi:hypothetical protein, partial [Delftia lacustris]|uniref:hypothetical protein n=1 Tax=Delftia lacustris TaxID=558537 RepID=UPI0019CFAC21
WVRAPSATPNKKIPSAEMHWGFLLWAQTLSSSGWKLTGYSHRQLRCGWIAAAHAAVDFQALGARPAS